MSKMEQYKNIRTRKDYDLLLKSGMFWVAYPELSGDYQKDLELITPNKSEHRATRKR